MDIKKQIKQKELEVQEWWNSTFNGKIEMVEDEFSTYDFEGEKVIVELKHRFKAYDTKLIESMKLSNNYQQSQLKNKTFFYVVVDANGISMFNISNNISEIIKLTEYNKLMEHTHYWSDNKPKIMKLHRNLPERLSVIWELNKK